MDHLADIALVLGTDRRLRTQTVLTRLAEHNPEHYEGWTFTTLKTTLDEWGVAPVKSDGVMVIRTEDITQAITERDHGTSDPGDEDTGS